MRGGELRGMEGGQNSVDARCNRSSGKVHIGPCT